MFKVINNRKGSMLAMVVIIMAVGMILGTALLSISLAESNFTMRQENRMQADYIARSAAQSVAEYMIGDPGNASAILGKSSDVNTQIADGEFTVEVVRDDDTNLINVLATGTYNGIKQQAKIQMDETSSLLGGIFDHAIVTKESITVRNNAGTEITIEGTIASNGSISDVLDGKAWDIFEYQNFVFPPIEEPESYDIVYPNGIDLKNNHDSIVLNTGAGNEVDVLVDGDLSVHNNEIEVTGSGEVHMYIKGDIDIKTHGLFNVGTNAKLFLYVIGERTLTFSGTGDFNNMLIYAPDSHVEWQNAQGHPLRGAIISKTAELHNFTYIIHDEELSSGVRIDDSGIGVTFTGYTWLD